MKTKSVILISLICLAFIRTGFCKDSMESMRSEHFIIYYDEDIDQAYVRKVKDMCERFYWKITKEFNLVRNKLWTWGNRAEVYIAKDKDAYADQFECPPWSAACTDYHGKVIYTYLNQERIKPTVAHELAHIIFREYVGFGNLPLWLDEGIASYIENLIGGSDLNIYLPVLKQKIASDDYISFGELNSIDYYSLSEESEEKVSVFYLESYSVVKFLVKRYGRSDFGSFLSYLRQGNNLDRAIAKTFTPAKSFDDLEGSWKKYYQK